MCLASEERLLQGVDRTPMLVGWTFAGRAETLAPKQASSAYSTKKSLAVGGPGFSPFLRSTRLPYADGNCMGLRLLSRPSSHWLRWFEAGSFILTPSPLTIRIILHHPQQWPLELFVRVFYGTPAASAERLIP